MPDKIEPAMWAGVYEESLSLLRAGNSMGIKVEDLGFAKKVYYSRDFERCKGDDRERHWSVVGDFDSKKNAESFEMHYDLKRYGREEGEAPKCKDEILYYMGGEKGRYITVFNDKTQGYPYHYTILSAASLVESRFPHFALVTGDIDIHQAKKSVEWANGILENKIDVPVCTDSKRLFSRLKKYFKGNKLIDLFQRFFCGETDEFYSIIFKEIKREILKDWFRMELKHYDSPGQVGASRLISYWLKECEDVRTLCEIACLDQKGPGFEPLKFVTSLCSGFSSKEKTKEILNFFEKPKGATDTVYRQLGSVFLTCCLNGQNAEWYIEKEKLKGALCSSFPDLSKEIGEIVDSRIKVATEEDIDLQKKKIEIFESLFTEDSDEPDFDDGKIFNQVKDYSSLGENLKLALRVIAFQMNSLKEKTLAVYSKHLKKITPKSIRKEIIKMIDSMGHIMITEEIGRAHV